jgi:hypothetical protein
MTVSGEFGAVWLTQIYIITKDVSQSAPYSPDGCSQYAQSNKDLEILRASVVSSCAQLPIPPLVQNA